MTLSRKIADTVEAADAASVSLQVEEGRHRLALRLTEFGPVGLAFTGLRLAVTDLDGPLSVESLRAWGDRLAARITYLMEPLVIHEVDAEAGEASLRSKSPTARADHASFYEVRLGCDGTLDLRRHSFHTGVRVRGLVSCKMTVEVLERLVDDLVALSV